MANTHTRLARGFAAAVVLVHLLVGGYVFFNLGGFSESGLLAYLFTLSFALTGARGIWADRYKVATVGAVGMLVVAVLQNVFVIGLATLLAVALVLGYSGQEEQEQAQEQEQEQAQEQTEEQGQLEGQKETEEQEHEQLEEQTEEQEQKETEEQLEEQTEEQEQKETEEPSD